MGVFNGDIGRIQSIDPRGECITVDFEGRMVEYTPDMLGELEPAYAVTVHKAQGSEYRAVILAALRRRPHAAHPGRAVHRHHPGPGACSSWWGTRSVVARMVANNRQTAPVQRPAGPPGGGDSVAPPVTEKRQPAKYGRLALFPERMDAHFRRRNRMRAASARRTRLPAARHTLAVAARPS